MQRAQPLHSLTMLFLHSQTILGKRARFGEEPAFLREKMAKMREEQQQAGCNLIKFRDDRPGAQEISDCLAFGRRWKQ